MHVVERLMLIPGAHDIELSILEIYSMSDSRVFSAFRASGSAARPCHFPRRFLRMTWHLIIGNDRRIDDPRRDQVHAFLARPLAAMHDRAI